MKRKDVQEFARQLELGPESREYRANWVNHECPWARTKHAGGTDKSKGFGISCDNGVSAYFCLTCHTKGQFSLLPRALSKLRGKSYEPLVFEIQRTEIVGPRFVPRAWEERYAPETHDAAEDIQRLPAPASEFAYPSAIGDHYLRARNIGPRSVFGLGLRWDAYRRRVLFPVYDPRGAFVGFSGRAVDPPSSFDERGRPFDGSGNKYIKVRDYYGLRKRDFLIGEHRAFGAARNGRHALDVQRRGSVPARDRGPVIVVEGLFDYAWLYELGYSNVIGLMGSWFAEKRAARIRKYGRPLILFMDNDKPGYDAVEEIIKEFWGAVPMYRVEYPPDFVDADPASLPPAIVHSMIKNARLITAMTDQKALTRKEIDAIF